MSQLQLVMIRGKQKGRAWPVDARTLVLGRAEECDIVIADTIVSRRHCVVSATKKGLLIEDQGSRNPVLVNGLAVERGRLSAGDEISLGSAVLLVTSVDTGGPQHAPNGKDDTASLSAAGVMASKSSKDGKGRPRTVHDLASFYRITHALSTCQNTSELLARLAGELASWPGYRHCWIAREHGGGLTFYGVEETEAPRELMQHAFRNVRSMRECPNDTTVLMAVPILLHDSPIAVLSIELETAPTITPPSLEALTLLAHTIAPWITAIEGIARLKRDNERLQAHAGESNRLVGNSVAIKSVRKKILQAAPSELNILITGETGTGKELAALMCHAASRRSYGPMVVVNCAAIPRELFESELFGYVKGAFTGARQSTIGLVAQAHGGSLFLDEAGDLSLDNQARILRVIESGTFRRIGDKRESSVDIRVIAATNTDLQQAVREGRFREDLYHRLNGFRVHIPPLRERRDDVVLLADHFFAMAQQTAPRPHDGFTSAALKSLQERPWPGNVRELRNCVFRAIHIAHDRRIDAEDVCQFEESATSVPYQTMREAERRHIEAVLQQCNGNIRQAAETLDIGRSTLYAKIKEYNITA